MRASNSGNANGLADNRRPRSNRARDRGRARRQDQHRRLRAAGAASVRPHRPGSIKSRDQVECLGIGRKTILAGRRDHNLVVPPAGRRENLS